MILRIMARSYHYFLDALRLMDFIIVVTSMVEIVVTGTGVAPMLRVFRILRLFKTIQYLHIQMNVLMQTLKQAVPLIFLIVLFVFVFSQLGMHLFGCKFKFLVEDAMWRKNFDYLKWAMLTVFQILTLEDWNYMMYNAMVATTPWSVLYFVALIMLGKNLLINIFISIVIFNFEGLEEVHEVPAQHDEHHRFNVLHSSIRHAHTSPSEDNTSQASQRRWYCSTILSWYERHQDYSLFIFAPRNRLRMVCQSITSSVIFERIIFAFIIMNCIALALERPSLSPRSMERIILTCFDFFFVLIFLIEMLLKVVAMGLVLGRGSYCKNRWNLMDGLLVILSAVDTVVTLADSEHHNAEKNMLGILKVLRLLLVLYPLRVLKHTPQLRLAIAALLDALGPATNIVMISLTFMFMYAILGVQLFKGAFNNCMDYEYHDVRNSNITDAASCLLHNHRWTKRTYNFDNILQALMTLFVMYSKDGWVNIMYDGIDAVGPDIQPVTDYNPWRALYFVVFMIICYILLDMFIGTLVDI